MKDHRDPTTATATPYSTDYPRIRNGHRCPLCQNHKEPGLIVCWTCYHSHDLRNGLRPYASTIIDQAERDLTPHACPTCARMGRPASTPCPAKASADHLDNAYRATRQAQDAARRLDREGPADPDDNWPTNPTAARSLDAIADQIPSLEPEDWRQAHPDSRRIVSLSGFGIVVETVYPSGPTTYTAPYRCPDCHTPHVTAYEARACCGQLEEGLRVANAIRTAVHGPQR